MKIFWTLVLNCRLITFVGLLAKAADNMPPPGLVALFNGKDLTGWKGLVADPPTRAKMNCAQLAKAQKVADKVMRQHWKVATGQIELQHHGSYLWFKNVYLREIPRNK